MSSIFHLTQTRTRTYFFQSYPPPEASLKVFYGTVAVPFHSSSHHLLCQRCVSHYHNMSEFNSSSMRTDQHKEHQLQEVSDAIKNNDFDNASYLLSTIHRNSTGEVLSRDSGLLKTLLVTSISSSNSKVIGLVLDILKKVLDSMPSLVDEVAAASAMNTIPSIPQSLMTLIDNADLSVSDKASDLIEILIVRSNQEETSQAILEAFCRESDKFFSAAGMTMYLRFACTIAKIMGRGGSRLFNLCCDYGATSRIVDMCQNCNDVLVQVVVLDLLVEFAKSDVSLQYLIQKGTIEWLMTTSSNEGFLANQALGVVGDILTAAKAHSLLTSDLINRLVASNVLRTLETFVGSRTDADRATGLHALSSFAASSELALSLVVNDEILLGHWFMLLNLGNAEISAAVLMSVERILRCGNVNVNGGQRDISSAASEVKSSDTSAAAAVDGTELVVLKKKLLSQMGKAKQVTPVTFLVKTARQPIPEPRMASYKVMTAMCQQQPSGWGMLELCNTHGFRAFIEDRHTEFTKEGKDAKFGLVFSCTTALHTMFLMHYNKAFLTYIFLYVLMHFLLVSLILAIAETPEFQQFMDPQFRASIDTIIAQGPYYAPPRLEEPQVI